LDYQTKMAGAVKAKGKRKKNLISGAGREKAGTLNRNIGIDHAKKTTCSPNRIHSEGTATTIVDQLRYDHGKNLVNKPWEASGGEEGGWGTIGEEGSETGGEKKRCR